MTGGVDWPTRDLLTHRAASTPGATAVVDADHGREWSYGGLDALVDEVAAALDAAAGPGPVAALLSPRVATVTVVHAAHRLGRPYVALDPAWPAERVTGALDRLDPGALVCEADTETRALESAGGSACPVATVDSPTSDAVARLQPAEGAGPVEPAPLAREDTALVVFTSGTTGEPDAVCLTVGNLLASATASAVRLGVLPGDRWFTCLPMSHVGGLAPVLRAALYGTALVVQRGFDGETTPAAMASHGATGVSLVPTQLRRLLDADWRPHDDLRVVLLGGAPAGEDLLGEARAADVPVYPTYGTTETASQIATATPAAVREHPGTVGHPLVFTDVTIVEDGEPVAAGERGEIVVDGPTVTPGYLDDAATAAAVGEFGLHTGDLGYRDEAGRLWVEGRLDDRIVTGGETVQPGVVAEALEAHPDVAAAAVVGLPDPEWGEQVAALVVPDGPVADLTEHCKRRLAPAEVPKTVAVADALPRTASGTVDREAVRAALGDAD